MEPSDIIPEVIKDFAQKLLGPSTEEVGLWFREKIRFLRLRSQIKTFIRAREILTEAGFSEPKPVDIKTLIPLLEYCSLENEDSDLIEKWAGLLASASSYGLKIYAYPHILTQLSSNEAKILDFLFDYYVDERKNIEIRWVAKKDLSNKLLLKEDEVAMYLNNLFRLGLCRADTVAISIPKESTETNVMYGEATLTPLGADFVKACRGPNLLK